MIITTQVKDQIKKFIPGVFTLVMATGIIEIASGNYTLQGFRKRKISNDSQEGKGVKVFNM